MEEIVSHFGVVVCTRTGSDVDTLIYESDMLTRYKVISPWWFVCLSHCYGIAWERLWDRWHLSVCLSSLMQSQFWIKF